MEFDGTFPKHYYPYEKGGGDLNDGEKNQKNKKLYFLTTFFVLS